MAYYLPIEILPRADSITAKRRSQHGELGRNWPSLAQNDSPGPLQTRDKSPEGTQTRLVGTEADSRCSQIDWRRPSAFPAQSDFWRADALPGRVNDNIGAARNLLRSSVRAAPNRHGSADGKFQTVQPAQDPRRPRRSRDGPMLPLPPAAWGASLRAQKAAQPPLGLPQCRRRTRSCDTCRRTCRRSSVQ